ncbi:hypothetical protein RYX56_11270 [Alkalihalophilus lindianensis]|uniref:Fe-S oxidoreductase n=1 Tax=Alkalihalophilus lindianensis TaxID=1630542 RepID=A0ABU3XAN8_9BACI|nr:hypothetical protein [Alkalihalophilus lindianensis]MDV2684949.1 hypothetical protein [Alkalihalophilus lindianensis]
MDKAIKDHLKQTFFLTIDQLHTEAIYYYRQRELEKETTMKQVIEERTTALKGRDERVAGANMMKWIAYLCTAHQYATSIHDHWLSYEDVAFFKTDEEVGFTLINSEWQPLPEGGREQYITEKWIHLYTQLRPMVEKVALASGLPIQQTWGLLCNPFYKQQEAWMVTASDTRKQQINEDLHVLRNIKSDVFGLKRNPYQVSFRYVDSWWEPVEPVRVKAACCMSYVKESGKKCYACPKLTNEEREFRGKEIKKEKAQ